MCGRYTITIDPDTMRDELHLTDMPVQVQPRYNVAPTQSIATVRSADERKVEMMHWGLIPFWAKDPSIGSRLINARSETLLEKPAFKNAFAKRRCLIMADGFYEWQKGAGPKGRSQPYLFKLANDKPFAFAGLWEFWRSPEGQEVVSCTIITTDANELVKPVHERMPVLLTGDNLWAWLTLEQPEHRMNLLKPYPAEQMKSYPVSAMVNRPEVDSPELVLPVAV